MLVNALGDREAKKDFKEVYAEQSAKIDKARAGATDKDCPVRARPLAAFPGMALTGASRRGRCPTGGRRQGGNGAHKARSILALLGGGRGGYCAQLDPGQRMQLAHITPLGPMVARLWPCTGGARGKGEGAHGGDEGCHSSVSRPAKLAGNGRLSSFKRFFQLCGCSVGKGLEGLRSSPSFQ